MPTRRRWVWRKQSTLWRTCSSRRLSEIFTPAMASSSMWSTRMACAQNSSRYVAINLSSNFSKTIEKSIGSTLNDGYKIHSRLKLWVNFLQKFRFQKNKPHENRGRHLMGYIFFEYIRIEFQPGLYCIESTIRLCITATYRLLCSDQWSSGIRLWI